MEASQQYDELSAQLQLAQAQLAGFHGLPDSQVRWRMTCGVCVRIKDRSLRCPFYVRCLSRLDVVLTRCVECEVYFLCSSNTGRCRAEAAAVRRAVHGSKGAVAARDARSELRAENSDLGLLI